MSLVRLLGFTTMGCGCVSGRYRDVGTNREVTYIEEKGTSCANSSHCLLYTSPSPRDS